MVVARLLVQQVARPFRITGRVMNLPTRASTAKRSRQGAGAAARTEGNQDAVAPDPRPDPLSSCDMHLALEAGSLTMRGKYGRATCFAAASGSEPDAHVRAKRHERDDAGRKTALHR